MIIMIFKRKKLGVYNYEQRCIIMIFHFLVSQVFVMFHQEITLKWLSSMMSMGSLLVCNLLLPRNSFKDHMISLDPSGTVQIMSWVRR